MYGLSITDLQVAFKYQFSKRSDIHDYPTRHDNDLTLKSTHDPILWNLLLTRTKESKAVEHFRTQLKNKVIKTYGKVVKKQKLIVQIFIFFKGVGYLQGLLASQPIPP